MRSLLRVFLLGLLMLGCVCGLAQAQGLSSNPTCPNSGFLEGRAITDLCWDCFFPIQIIGVPIGWGTRGENRLPDDTAAPICVCPGRTGYPSPGITMGYWSPEHLIETVRMPWCSPMLGVQLIPNSTSSFQDIMGKAQLGGWDTDSASDASKPGGVGFYNFHWIKFPGGMLINMLMDMVCAPKGSDMDFAYVSEIDPTWQSDVLALYTAPETHVFAQMYARVVCLADAVAATVRKPIMGAYWCAGTWGQVYPMDGHVQQAGAYVTQMMSGVHGLAHMHRFGLAKLTYGDTAVCGDQFWFILPHEQYQFQNFYPRPVTTDAYWFGTSEYWAGSGIGRDVPVVGEDRLTMEWDFRNCCITFW